MDDVPEKKDTRYPYTYACDLVRLAIPMSQNGTKLSRSEAAQIRQLIATAIGMPDEELASILANFYLNREAKEFCYSCCKNTNVSEGGKYQPDFMLCPECGYDIYRPSASQTDQLVHTTNTDQSQTATSAPDGSESTPLLVGDYVLATKYISGDPQDHWCIGFFDSMLPKVSGDRYMVVDGEGNQFRGNGFRRVKKINTNEGRWLLEHKAEIRLSDRSLWDWLDSISDSQQKE